MKNPPPPGHDAPKGEWRRWAAGFDRSGSSEPVAAQLLQWPPLHGVVATYLAMATEIDLGVLLELDRCRIGVPRIETSGMMTIRAFRPDRLETHPMGFEQPVEASQRIPPEDIDIVLVPGLAFDRRGGRLGHGKGFYDSLLAQLPASTARIGITTDASIVGALPTDDHDQPVDWIATESGIDWVRGPLTADTRRVMQRAIEAGIAPRMHRFPEGTKTSKAAAKAVGCQLGAIAKSLVFEVDSRPVLVLCSGDRRVDEVRLAAYFGGVDARPASRDRVQQITGYPAGGTPALGHATRLDVVADVSLARYRWVWTAGGTVDTVFPVLLERLLAASGARWAEITTRG
ncbi:MAG: hypothetical protein BMS9Abin20_0359 [Acidimicrobiia bacterium]|nr:MAG: hypothetical protein BMS9Abin20_0359 [Acidimicrobiia bacterium]